MSIPEAIERVTHPPPARLLEVRRPDERLLLGEGRRVNLGGRRAFVHQPRVVEGLWWTYRIGLRA